MNSFETLTSKQRKEVKENLLKQIKVIEKLEAEENSNKQSSFKISLFSNKEDKEKVKVDKEKNKAEKEKSKVDKVKKENTKSSKEENDDDKKPRAIKATISSMKEVLDYHHVDYPSNAKKDDLAELLRKNNLVREAEKKELNKKSDK